MIVLSLLVMGIGAVLRWAVTATANGIDLAMVGLILLIIGAAGFVLAAIEWLGWWSWRERRRTRVVEQQVISDEAPTVRRVVKR